MSLFQGRGGRLELVHRLKPEVIAADPGDVVDAPDDASDDSESAPDEAEIAAPALVPVPDPVLSARRGRGRPKATPAHDAPALVSQPVESAPNPRRRG